MHWIIDWRNDRVWPVWRQQILSRGLPCDVVRVLPYTQLTVPEVRPQGRVMCLGNTTGHDNLARVARAKGWAPAFWDEGFDARLWNEQLGESMLNASGTYTQLGRLADELRGDVFVRPVSETKAFHGGILRFDSVQRLREDLRRAAAKLRPEIEVLVAPVVAIEAEFRFFVVKGSLVTWSRYHREDARNWSGDVPEEIVAFAQTIVDRWGPGEAYVMDVARCERGLKVVEFNCINASSLCGGDAGAVVDALEAAFG